MANTKKPTEAGADVLTKVRVNFGGSFSFEAEGREAIVLDAYQRALEAFLAVSKVSESKESK